MRIGYARVSTPDQSFTLQRDALEQSGCSKVLTGCKFSVAQMRLDAA